MYFLWTTDVFYASIKLLTPPLQLYMVAVLELTKKQTNKKQKKTSMENPQIFAFLISSL